uniref:Reverse transcriptase Ty1/copia-type domain-containing protein n=1 Tax=Fagus sylvatica TaxID=28930 RepID=A0A2N9HSX5_FAGSY
MSLYGEHPNGGMTEIESRDIDFIETDFPSIGNANRDLDLYELEEDEWHLTIFKRGWGISSSSYVDEPASFSEALHSPNRDEWMTAMQEEMNSMDKNNVWELVDLSPGCRTIGNKWVLKVKRKDRWDMSAKCVVSNFSIYGLKQSSRQWWYLRFHDSITSFGFEMIEEDHCVYLKRSKRSILILSLYVDDILLAGNDMDSIVTTKKWLSSSFEMKDMGEANFVLGVKITRDRSKKLLSLSQGTYIKKILERFHMHNSKPIDTPMEKGCTLSLDQCPKNDEEKNQIHMLWQLAWLVAIRAILDLLIGERSRGFYNTFVEPLIMLYVIMAGDLRLTGYSDAD